MVHYLDLLSRIIINNGNVRRLFRGLLLLLLVVAPDVSLAQVREVDLTRVPVETVVSGEYDGGYLARVGDIVVREEGLWVADNGHAKVFWFGHDGTLRQEYGGRGGGPGEFGIVGDIAVDSLVTVGDPRLGRTVKFRLDGTHVETLRGRTVADPAFALRMGSYRPLRGGAAVGGTLSHIAYRPENSRPNVHVVVFMADGEKADTVLTYHSGAAGYKVRGTAGVFFPPAGSSGAWDASGDSLVFLADGIKGEVVVLNVGDGVIDTAAVLEAGRQGRKISDSDLRRIRDGLRDEMGLPESFEIGNMPSHWSVASELVVVPTGDLWLRQATEHEDNSWLVLDADLQDRVLAKLPVDFRLKAVSAGRLYGVVTDELDVPSIGAIQWRP